MGQCGKFCFSPGGFVTQHVFHRFFPSIEQHHRRRTIGHRKSCQTTNVSTSTTFSTTLSTRTADTQTTATSYQPHPRNPSHHRHHCYHCPRSRSPLETTHPNAHCHVVQNEPRGPTSSNWGAVVVVVGIVSGSGGGSW